MNKKFNMMDKEYTIDDLNKSFTNGGLSMLQLIHITIRDEKCDIIKITKVIEGLMKKIEDKLGITIS